MDVIIGVATAFLIFTILRLRAHRKALYKNLRATQTTLERERQAFSEERENLTSLLYDSKVHGENLTADLNHSMIELSQLKDRLRRLNAILRQDVELKLPDDVKATALIIKKMQREGRTDELEQVQALLGDPGLLKNVRQEDDPGDPWDGPLFQD